eukprot:jgi/Chlat1/6530/Chrsp45S06005
MASSLPTSASVSWSSATAVSRNTSSARTFKERRSAASSVTSQAGGRSFALQRQQLRQSQGWSGFGAGQQLVLKQWRKTSTTAPCRSAVRMEAKAPPGKHAKVVENVEVSRGTRLLTMQADESVAYEPGHVFALWVQDSDSGKWIRHPYTVTRCEPNAGQVSFVYRVIQGGKMTGILESLSEGAELRFDGEYHVPILKGMAPGSTAVVGVATGSGIGPLYGFVEQALQAGLQVPVLIVAGFRDIADVALADQLEKLASKTSNLSLELTLTNPSSEWTGLTGRVTDVLPSLLSKHGLNATQQVHFHLVGNGAMINLLQATLHKAGVSKEYVTVETYFNHNKKADPAEVEKLALNFRV